MIWHESKNARLGIMNNYEKFPSTAIPARFLCLRKTDYFGRGSFWKART